MKRIIYVLLFLCFAGIQDATAQTQKVVAAWNYLNIFKQDGDNESLLQAWDNIQEASKHEKTGSSAKTWYYMGEISLALLSSEEHKDYHSDALSSARKGFENAIKFDGKGRKARYKSDALINLSALTALMYNKGSESFQDKKFEEAHSRFAQIIALDEFIAEQGNGEMEVDTVTLLAAAYSAEKANLPEAKGYYEQLVKTKMKEIAVYQSLAAIYTNEGETEKAASIMALAKELFPNNKGLIIDEVNKMLGSGDNEAALAKIEEAIPLDPENEGLYFAKGTILDAKKDVAGAEAAYKKAIELEPNYYDAYYNLGAIWYNQAAEQIKQMRDLPIDAEAEYSSLKTSSESLFAKALPFFEKAFEIKNTDRNAMIALKEIYAKMGNFEKSNEMKKLLGM